jgi:hypothetical protein
MDYYQGRRTLKCGKRCFNLEQDIRSLVDGYAPADWNSKSTFLCSDQYSCGSEALVNRKLTGFRITQSSRASTRFWIIRISPPKKTQKIKALKKDSRNGCDFFENVTLKNQDSDQIRNRAPVHWPWKLKSNW